MSGHIRGLPKSRAWMGVSARRRGLAIPIDVEEDGTFVTPPLPAKTKWTIAVQGPGFQGSRDVDVAAGATVEVRVR